MGKLWGSFEFLERASARISCAAGGCEVLAIDCGDRESDRSAWDVRLQDALWMLLASEAPMADPPDPASLGGDHLMLGDVLKRFQSIHLLAQIARCSYGGDWPPVRFAFSTGF